GERRDDRRPPGPRLAAPAAAEPGPPDERHHDAALEEMVGGEQHHERIEARPVPDEPVQPDGDCTVDRGHSPTTIRRRRDLSIPEDGVTPWRPDAGGVPPCGRGPSGD